jgi:hypothetical protein
VWLTRKRAGEALQRGQAEHEVGGDFHGLVAQRPVDWLIQIVVGVLS